MAEAGKRFTRDLTIRYVAVLAALGLLVILSFLGTVHSIVSAENGLSQSAVSSSQRVLIQRAAFTANRLAAVPAAERPAVAALLAETLDHLAGDREKILAAIRTLPPADGLVSVNTPGRAIGRDLDLFIAQGRAVLERATTLDGGDADLRDLSMAASGPLLAALDDLTLRLRLTTDSRMHDMLAVQGGALMVALGMLLVSAFGVFHPMVERLRADFTDRLEAERRLRDSEERLRLILEESPIGVSVSRRVNGRIVFANRRFAEILGVSRESLIGSRARDLYVDETQRREVLDDLRLKGCIDGAEVEFRRRDGRPFWSLLTIRSTDFEGESVNLAWIYDITSRKAAEQQILLSAKVLETLNEAVLITDAATRIIFVNPAFTAITEYRRDEAIGRTPALLNSGRHDNEFYQRMWDALLSTGSWSGEIWNRRKSGELYPEWLSIVAIREANGLIGHFVAVFSDITHRKEDEARVWRQANYDALTGLPNRSLFIDRLSQSVRQAQREPKPFAVVFIDLDGFKAVNDRLGHAAGDLLLQQAAGRLSECVRASDTVARLAGDEFVMILQGIGGREEPTRVVGKILDLLARPFVLDGHDAQVQGSIGIALYPDDAQDGPGLIARADQAMYAVKRRGKNNFCFASELDRNDRAPTEAPRLAEASPPAVS